MAEGRVTATSLNLRDAPNGAVVARLRHGAGVTILDARDGWLSVSVAADGATKLGWVNARFIDTNVGVPLSADDDSTSVAVVGGKAIGPDGRSFASRHGKGFVTVGLTTLDSWLAGNPAGPNLAPSLMRVVRAVSRNEGRLEAINSYDNSFLSFGMFQWTAGPNDKPGELAGLLALVERTNRDVFQRYFGRYGLGTAVQGTAKTGFLTLSDALLKEPADKDKLRAVEWAYRFWRAGQDDTVRACQLNLAAGRVSGFLSQHVAGHPVLDWLSSEYGVALLLDEHVNRPGHVPGTLKRCIAALPRGADPVRWGDQEEADLIDRYVTARVATNMTHPGERAISIGACVDAGTLSDKRGSFAATAAAPSV